MQGQPCCVNPVPYIQSQAASTATGQAREPRASCTTPAQRGHGQVTARQSVLLKHLLLLHSALFRLCQTHSYSPVGVFFKICCLKVKISVKPKNVLKFAENATNPQLDLFRVIPSIDVTSAPEKCRRSINKRFKLLCKISPRKVFKGWCKMGSKF